MMVSLSMEWIVALAVLLTMTFSLGAYMSRFVTKQQHQDDLDRVQSESKEAITRVHDRLDSVAGDIKEILRRGNQ